eukprot:8524182-Pyramimonas_sp.AAC.1
MALALCTLLSYCFTVRSGKWIVEHVDFHGQGPPAVPGSLSLAAKQCVFFLASTSRRPCR